MQFFSCLLGGGEKTPTFSKNTALRTSLNVSAVLLWSALEAETDVLPDKEREKTPILSKHCSPYDFEGFPLSRLPPGEGEKTPILPQHWSPYEFGGFCRSLPTGGKSGNGI